MTTPTRQATEPQLRRRRVEAVRLEMRRWEALARELAALYVRLVTESRIQLVGAEAELLKSIEADEVRVAELLDAYDALIATLKDANANAGMIADRELLVETCREAITVNSRSAWDRRLILGLRVELWRREGVFDSRGNLLPLREARPDEFSWMSRPRDGMFAYGRESLWIFASLRRHSARACQKADMVADQAGRATRGVKADATKVLMALDQAEYMLTNWLVDVINPDVTDDAAQKRLPRAALNAIGHLVGGPKSACGRLVSWVTERETQTS